MTISFPEQREILRLRLQAQRQLFGRQFASAVYDDNQKYPRSMAMSLLSRRSTVAVWAATELLPVLVIHFLGNTGHSLLHALQTHGGFSQNRDGADANPLRNC
jgi:hypothetical protein